MADPRIRLGTPESLINWLFVGFGYHSSQMSELLVLKFTQKKIHDANSVVIADPSWLTENDREFVLSKKPIKRAHNNSFRKKEFTDKLVTHVYVDKVPSRRHQAVRAGFSTHGPQVSGRPQKDFVQSLNATGSPCFIL